MKKRISKDLFIFMILIPLFLWSAFFISSRMEKQLPSYSVINKSRMGCSVLYEAMKELNYPVERTLSPISSYDVNSLQIVPNGGSFNVNSEEVKDWIGKGGTLIYLSPLDLSFINFTTEFKSRGNMLVYEYKAGTIIVADALSITNKAIGKNSKDAYGILLEIEDKTLDKIYFNEGYLFTEGYKRTLWEYIPLGVKFILYQLLITVVGIFYFKGKRFGKNIPLYEEVERSENEYLYSAAALYKQAKCYDIMVENYYKSFLKEVKLSHETWLEYWEKENLPKVEKAKKLHKLMPLTKKVKIKEYYETIMTIEELRNVFRKRRDSVWKTMKKSL